MNDKLKHFLVTIGISLLVMLFFRLFTEREMYNWDAGIACFIGILANVFKEVIWDKLLNRGKPEYYDFFWGFTGAVVGPMAWLFIEAIIFEIKY